MEIQEPYLFSGSSDATVRIWDLTTLRCRRTLRQRSGITVLDVHRDLLLTAAADHTLRVLDWRRGEELGCFQDDAALVACSIAEDGWTFLCGGRSGQLQILRGNTPMRALRRNRSGRRLVARAAGGGRPKLPSDRP